MTHLTLSFLLAMVFSFGMAALASAQTVRGDQVVVTGSTSGTVTIVPAAIVGGDFTITLPKGTTDLSSTGGASQVLKQLSAGGAITVATVAASDLASRSDLTGTANQVVLSASGTNALTGGNAITLSLPQSIATGSSVQFGKLGLGVAPTRFLDVLGTTEQMRLAYDASNYNAFTVSSVGSLTIAATGTNPNITLTPGGTGYTILNGNVGIGMTGPAEKLQVAGAIKMTGAMTTDTASSGGMDYFSAGVRFFSWGASGATKGIYTWFAKGSDGSSSTPMIIDNGGNVGIGTTGPASKLDVNGIISLGGFTFAYNATNYNRLVEPAGTPAIYLGNATDPSNYYDNTSHYFRTRAGGANYMTIISSGNVGIGTTGPGSALTVNGGIALATTGTGAGDLTISNAVPTISSGFGTGPSVTAGKADAFRVNVGTGGLASGGVVAMNATATTGWNCHVDNLTAVAANRADQRTVQTASTTTTVTVQNQTISTGAALVWTASDILALMCLGF